MFHFMLALALLQRGYDCDRCEDTTPGEFVVLCASNCYHIQCLACALHTDKERRVEEHEYAWLS